MPTDNQAKSSGSVVPVHEAAGSNEFTSTTGCYAVRLPEQPKRDSGGFIFEKLKDLYDYYWHYYRWGPTRVATRFMWSENGWESLKDFTTTGMWKLDVDAPVTQRLAAGLGFGLKSSIFIYAVYYSSLRTRYQLPRNAALIRALRPCALVTTTCLVYSGAWPIVRAARGYQQSEISKDVDAAIVGAVSGVAFSAMWIRNSRFIGISIPIGYIFGAISVALYSAAHAGYGTQRSISNGWMDPLHWTRGNLIFGPPHEERLAKFRAQLQDRKYKEYLETSVKTSW